MRFDVRTYLVILVSAATCASLNTDIYVEFGIIAALFILQLASGKGVCMPRLIAVYIAMLIIQFVVFPIAPELLTMVLSMFVVNVRGFFPTIMCIVLIYKTTQVSQLSATMAKMKIPKSVTITVAITIRYIPTLIEEWRHIREAMSVRRVTAGIRNPFVRIAKSCECYLIPLFMSAIRTSDELSAAAITRGIDNPAMPTCRKYRPMGTIDFLAIMIAVVTVGACAWLRYG